jgi:hypothetical protein
VFAGASSGIGTDVTVPGRGSNARALPGASVGFGRFPAPIPSVDAAFAAGPAGAVPSRLRRADRIRHRRAEKPDTADNAFDGRTADHERPVAETVPADVFDQQAHTFSARADFQATPILLVFGAYACCLGDVASSTQRNAQIFAASSAVVVDPAFGSNVFAYKIDATTHILSAGVSVALGARWSLNVSCVHQIGLGDGGIDYHNNIVGGTVLFSY